MHAEVDCHAASVADERPRPIMPDFRVKRQEQEGLNNLSAPPAALERERHICVDQVKTFLVHLWAPELAGDGEQTCEKKGRSLSDVMQRVQ
jgi:hypothetical protein